MCDEKTSAAEKVELGPLESIDEVFPNRIDPDDPPKKECPECQGDGMGFGEKGRCGTCGGIGQVSQETGGAIIVLGISLGFDSANQQVVEFRTTGIGRMDLLPQPVIEVLEQFQQVLLSQAMTTAQILKLSQFQRTRPAGQAGRR